MKFTDDVIKAALKIYHAAEHEFKEIKITLSDEESDKLYDVITEILDNRYTTDYKHHM